MLLADMLFVCGCGSCALKGDRFNPFMYELKTTVVFLVSVALRILEDCFTRDFQMST